MGLLDRIRGKGDLAVTVTLDPEEVLPGQDFEVLVGVSGALDEDVRGLRVVFEGRGDYRVKQRTYGSTVPEEVERTITLHSETDELPAALGATRARFRVPDGAPPTSSAVVTWDVTATLVRAGVRDVSACEELLVITAPANVPAVAPRSDVGPSGLTLTHLPAAVAEDSELAGTLIVRPEKEMQCAGVRIHLVRRLTYRGEVAGDLPGSVAIGRFVMGSSDSHIVDDSEEEVVEIAGARVFSAGVQESFDFSVTIPLGAGVTAQHPHARVEWLLQGVLDLPRRHDLTVEAPVFVYSELVGDDDDQD